MDEVLSSGRGGGARDAFDGTLCVPSVHSMGGLADGRQRAFRQNGSPIARHSHGRSNIIFVCGTESGRLTAVVLRRRTGWHRQSNRRTDDDLTNQDPTNHECSLVSPVVTLAVPSSGPMIWPRGPRRGNRSDSRAATNHSIRTSAARPIALSGRLVTSPADAHARADSWMPTAALSEFVASCRRVGVAPEEPIAAVAYVSPAKKVGSRS